MPRAARCRTFDFNPCDFLNDANVVIMNLEERGAYITLLCRAWDLSIPGVLPDDEGVIRRLIGATTDEWDRVRGALRRCFDTSDGRWIQKRMHREYTAQSARLRTSEHQSRAGRARASRTSRDWHGKFASNKALPPAATSQTPAPPYLLTSLPPETKTESKTESKTEQKNQGEPLSLGIGGLAVGPSARAVARCKLAFPEVDVDFVSLKLVAYHEHRPYKNLDIALLTWCKLALKRGQDLLEAVVAPVKKLTLEEENRIWENHQRHRREMTGG